MQLAVIGGMWWDLVNIIVAMVVCQCVCSGMVHMYLVYVEIHTPKLHIQCVCVLKYTVQHTTEKKLMYCETHYRRIVRILAATLLSCELLQ